MTVRRRTGGGREEDEVGNPLSLSTQIGAVNSLTQLEGNLGFVADAAREGGEIVIGGRRTLEETGGWYMTRPW